MPSSHSETAQASQSAHHEEMPTTSEMAEDSSENEYSDSESASDSDSKTSPDTQKITSTASPLEKDEQLLTETEESNVTSWSARAAQCELQSTSQVLKLLSESDCSAFHKWYFSVDNKRSFEIVSNLEPNGNYEIYNCYGTTQSMGKETSRTYYRCANPNAPSCSWVTSVNRAMSRHQNTTTHSPGIGDVFCPYCKKYYSRPDSLKRHINKLGCKEGPKPLEAPDGGNK